MKKWTEVRSKMSPESRARVDARVREAITAMPLGKLRRARNLTQVAIAEKLQVDQGAVSKIERRADMYVGTLREYIEAAGGQLELRAVFPDGDVQVRLADGPE